MPSRRFESYAAFYEFYLSQHQDRTCRVLHATGVFLMLGVVGAALATGTWWLLAAAPVVGYGFAWVGHLVFEGNRPATFGHPLAAAASDFRMTFDMVTGRLARRDRERVAEPAEG